MAKVPTEIKPITESQCREWIETKVFPLQPEAYRNQYPGFPGAVGLEIEMLPLKVEGGRECPLRVALQGPRSTLAAWLRQMASRHGWRAAEADSAQGALLMGIKLDQEDNLSFEPGGQLEFSSRPYHCLSEAISRTKYVQALLDRELGELGGIELLQVGLNPWHTIDEIGLQMQKPRYIAMNDFFSKISVHGPRMMRQTCTVQVNLDFGPTETMMAKRFLASMLMAPITGSIFNYSAFEAGQPTGVTGLRQTVWRHLDPSRTGIPDLSILLSRLDKKACVDTWFQFVMAARVVFVTRQNYRVMHERFTWDQWLKSGIDGLKPDAEDFETHLSLLFPEVRARGFLELRSVDCQARVWQFAPAAWWTGLLYDHRALDQVLELMTPYANKIGSLLEAADQGLSNPTMAVLAKKLSMIAIEGLGRLPGCYFGGGALKTLTVFVDRFVERGRVPSNDLLEAYARQGSLNIECFRKVESEWQRLLDDAPEPSLI